MIVIHIEMSVEVIRQKKVDKEENTEGKGCRWNLGERLPEKKTEKYW